MNRSGGRACFSGAETIRRDHVADARCETASANSIAEGDQRFAVVGLAHDVNLVLRLDAEERRRLGPLQAIDIDLEGAGDAVGGREVGQRTLLELEGLIGKRGVAVPQYLARHGLAAACRSEEHTSELQSRSDLVCRLLL